MDVKIVLIGKGNVGTSLIELLKENNEILNEKFNLNFKMVAIVEYDGALINEDGINLEEVLSKGETYRELPY